MSPNNDPHGTEEQSSSEQRPQTRSVSFQSLHKHDNHLLPIMWIDALNLSLRSDQDGSRWATMRGYAYVPDSELACEVVRLQCTGKLLKQIVDLIAKAIDYYPTKPSA